ncbi:MAG TPA: acyl carrier protein [Firmicutes bacterium]|nr:acyl carrier protein [Bacillota bacterium]
MTNYEKVLENLKTKLKIENLDANATLASLGLDSLDVVEFVLDLEDEYGITFEPSETQDIKTLGDLLRLIKSKLGDK